MKSGSGTLIVGHALVWAALMLGLSFVFRGNEVFSEHFVIIAIGFYFISAAFLTKALKR